jgi:dynein heavy chain
MLQINPISMQENDQFASLWLHECSRVFSDRLVTEQDKNFFRTQTLEILNQKFKASWATSIEEAFGGGNGPIFSTILKLDDDKPTYDLIENRGKLVRVLGDKIIDYQFSTSTNMNLVFFADAVNYVCAITRILSHPKGNAMLIGVSGSGKQSLTRLATFMLEQQCFQLQLTKNFKPADFRETLRLRMLQAGCENKKSTFLLSDT